MSSTILNDCHASVNPPPFFFCSVCLFVLLFSSESGECPLVSYKEPQMGGCFFFFFFLKCELFKIRLQEIKWEGGKCN